MAIRSLVKYWNTPDEDATWAYLQEESPVQFETEERLKQSQTAIVSVA